LLAWLAFGRHETKARSIVLAALSATYVLAIGIAGLWLVLPWWLPFAYGAGIVWTIAHRLRRNDDGSPRPRVVWALVVQRDRSVAVVLGTSVWPSQIADPFNPIDWRSRRSGTYWS
jgi:hypothetical protein